VQKLFVKRLTPGCILPKKANKYAAGYDLYSSNTEDLIIKAHSKELVPTGCALAIPHGNYGRIAPRSGLAWKHHLDVGAGVIDSDFLNGSGLSEHFCFKIKFLLIFLNRAFSPLMAYHRQPFVINF
jgi:dUTP pyrophosphatase